MNEGAGSDDEYKASMFLCFHKKQAPGMSFGGRLLSLIPAPEHHRRAPAAFIGETP